MEYILLFFVFYVMFFVMQKYQKNTSFSQNFAFVSIILLTIISIYIFFGQNSFHYSSNLWNMFHRGNFALNPMTHFGVFRSEIGNFFLFEHYKMNQVIPKSFLFLLFGFFLPLIYSKTPSTKNILTIWLSIAILVELLQILVIIVAFLLSYQYSGTFSTGAIFAHFIAFCIGFLIYKILPNKK